MRYLLVLIFMMVSVLVSVAFADQRYDPREQAISDALDLWREGRYEQLYDTLSHRSSVTREKFVSQLKETSLRPSCCHQKLNDFRLIVEKRTTAKVFARLGMESDTGASGNHSREFTLDHEEGRWKMRLSDIKALAAQGQGKKKKR